MALDTGTVHTYSSNTWSWSDVVSDAEGNFYLAYKNDSTSINVDKWNAATNSWESHASFSVADTPGADTSFSDDLDLAVSEDGNLHLVFRHSNQIDFDFGQPRGVSYGEFDGSTWTFSVVEQASDSSGWKNYDDPSMVIDSEGNAHIAYLYSDVNGTGQHHIRYATNESGSWVTSSPVLWDGPGSRGTNELHEPSLTIRPDGTISLVYIDEDDQNTVHGNIYAMERSPDGVWSTPTMIFDGVSAGRTPIYDIGATDADGYQHLIYADADGSLYDLTNASGSWQSQLILPTSANASYATDYQEVNGIEYMLVTDTDGATYFYYNSGSGWQKGDQGITGESDLDFAVNIDGAAMVITLDADLRVISYGTGPTGAQLANRDPVVSGPVTLPAADEDTSVTITAAQLMANASDLDGDTLSVANLVAATGTLVDNGDGTWTYTPVANDNSSVTLSYDVVDGNGGTVSTSATFDLAPVNDAPTDIALSDNSIAQSAGVNGVVGTLTATDVDEGETFTYSLISGAGDTNNAMFSLAGNSLRANDAAALDAGTYSIRLRVTDSGGLSFEKAFSITVADDVDPAVSSVTVPANGTYGTGDNLDFTVNLNEAVLVDTTGGTPTIAITLGTGGTVYATYISGSGSNALVFRLTIGAGQRDLDGIALGGSIELNGATIRDASGNNVATSLNSVGSTAGVLVDTFSSPSSIALSANAVDENDAGAVIGSLSTVDPDANPGDVFTYSILGAAADRFEVVDGTLKLKAGIWLDFEIEPSVDVTVRSVDKDGLSVDETLTIVVGDINPEIVTGSAGDDVIHGGNGNDIINGRAGADDMYGGGGNDIYVVDDAGDSTIELPGDGIDTVRSYIDWTLGDNVERLELSGAATNGTGNVLANTLVGNNSANVLRGEGGDDYLTGLGGNDVLYGGNGNDRLVGAAGADILYGGAGNDVFRFEAVTDSPVGPGNRDIIMDFARGQDRISLYDVDANITMAGDQAFTFLGNAAFSGAAGQLRYSAYGNVCLVDGDVNGDGIADFQIQVNGTHWMTGTDFIL
ncbi:cadherin-like domain-containing protein [Mesorhizobium sp. CAU 1732]|uniref:cadherin-like domain-containing protein n=1 Tax=Mesorhizobium sp. CAU 1732 TaxID=3140358 RepID=UPI0032619C02